jgi:uncharacterized tellurite resistance protein B-like protein
MSKQLLKIDIDKEELNQIYKTAIQKIQDTLRIDPSDKDTGDRAARMAQFVASRLGKEIWSERQEITGADGEALLSSDEVLKRLANLNSVTPVAELDISQPPTEEMSSDQKA